MGTVEWAVVVSCVALLGYAYVAKGDGLTDPYPKKEMVEADHKGKAADDIAAGFGAGMINTVVDVAEPLMPEVTKPLADKVDSAGDGRDERLFNLGKVVGVVTSYGGSGGAVVLKQLPKATRLDKVEEAVDKVEEAVDSIGKAQKSQAEINKAIVEGVVELMEKTSKEK